MFPAIKDAFREFREGLPGELTTLDLKSGGFGFNTVNISDLEYAKQNRIRMALGGGGPVWSGETVSEVSALNNSVVFACTRIIAETSASLPLFLMRRTSEGRFPADNKALYYVLHDEPNEDMSDMEWREATTARCVLRGNAYGLITRRPLTGECIGIYPLDSVNPDKDKQNRLIYEVPKQNGVDNKTYVVEPNKPHDIFHLRGLGFDGIKGCSVIGMARQSIGTAISAEKYAAKFYAAGGRVPYVIEMAQRFRSDEDFAKWRADWNNFYGSSDNYHQAVVMEPGMTYKQIGLAPDDSQFLETRQFGIPEVCRWFRISPHLVGDLSRATFSNIEHLAIEFVTQTLMAWLVRWEKAIYRCLLTPAEKSRGLYAKHNVNALLRGDFASRMAGYSTALQNGIYNRDEVRDLEDRNPLPGDAGKSYTIQLNMQTLPGTGEPTAAERAALAKTEETEGDDDAA
jgi:HK97 family phage portal protein